LDKLKDRGYSGEGVRMTLKKHQHVYLVHRLLYTFLVVHTVRYKFLPQMVPLPLLLLLNPHTFHPHIRKVHKIFHPHLLLVRRNKKTCIPTSARDQIFHPHHHAHLLLLLLLLLMKQQNLHTKTEVLKTITAKEVHLGLIPL
jgi:hypothetical protein